MKRFKFLLQIVFLILFFTACGQPSLEDDARKAAELSNMSSEYALDGDINAAEKYYKDAQTIIDKYRFQADKFDEFFLVYNGFLEAGAYKQLESHISEMDNSQP